MEKQKFIQNNSGLSEKSIHNTLALLSEGATVPFIARYRKERTGGLDELQISSIRDLSKTFDDLIARQKTILNAIEEQGKLTPELESKIKSCFDNNVLEDLYLPFKQKKLTRGEKARKAGLEPLAKMIMSQRGGVPEVMASKFVKGEIQDEEMAIQGAMDIIAEWVNESTFARERMRTLFQRRSVVQTKLIKGKEEEGVKYKDYFNFSEQASRIASHRFLAISRAEKEGIISLKALPDQDEAISQLERIFVKGTEDCSEIVAKSTRDSYKRLMAPSLENELLNALKKKADEEAIKVFSLNLKQLLLSSPLGNKRILAIDPGYRTGCKVVCLDENGDLLTNVTIYPHPPQNEFAQAQAKLSQLVQAYKIEAIAVGDGTAGRETESLVKKTRFDRVLQVFVVREDGASIYSASSVARKEFPQHDVTVRGAVSIGRRLMDPLSELVKIDPKSVGVGQYQHEVDQAMLKTALDDVVISCVNSVGVDLNTASPYLLSYVSGLGPALAENIIEYRAENGRFESREELKKVKRLGERAYEQAAGFLRIRGGGNPLDNSAVHPESYKVVEKIAKKKGMSVPELIGNMEVLSNLDKREVEGVDEYTFNDIISELIKPGRDPRRPAKVLEFDSSVRTINDLRTGMTLPGIVTNVTAFGAFVNLGIKENGLIHISNLSDQFVSDPSTVISLHEHVEVEVIEVDVQLKRIGLKRK